MNKQLHLADWRLVRAAVVVGAVLLGLAVGLGVGLLQRPSYQSTAYMAVVPANLGVDQTTATKFAAAYARVAASPSVLLAPGPQAAVIDPATTAPALQVTANPDAPLIELNATTPDPGHAAALANGVGARLTQYADTQAAATGVRVIPFVTAVPPIQASGPNVALDAAVGAAAGLLVGGLLLLAAPTPPGQSLAERIAVPGAPRSRSRTMIGWLGPDQSTQAAPVPDPASETPTRTTNHDDPRTNPVSMLGDERPS